MLNQELNKNIDAIQPAEKPKTLFESFWNKVFVLELEDKIKESVSKSDTPHKDPMEIVRARIEKDEMFCKKILDSFENFIENHDPKNSVFLWDIQGTLGIFLDEFVTRDSLEFLIRFIKSKYPELRMGILSDFDPSLIDAVLESNKAGFLKRFLNKELLFSVAESKDPSSPGHFYSELLKKLGGGMNSAEIKNINKVEPPKRKKRIAHLLEEKGLSVFAVDDLPWGDKKRNDLDGYGARINSMLSDFVLYH